MLKIEIDRGKELEKPECFNDKKPHLPTLTPLAMGPTISKLRTLTMPNRHEMRTMIEMTIQKRPVPPSPNAFSIGIHQ